MWKDILSSRDDTWKGRKLEIDFFSIKAFSLKNEHVDLCLKSYRIKATSIQNILFFILHRHSSECFYQILCFKINCSTKIYIPLRFQTFFLHACLYLKVSVLLIFYKMIHHRCYQILSMYSYVWIATDLSPESGPLHIFWPISWNVLIPTTLLRQLIFFVNLKALPCLNCLFQP